MLFKRYIYFRHLPNSILLELHFRSSILNRHNIPDIHCTLKKRALSRVSESAALSLLTLKIALGFGFKSTDLN